MPRAPPLGSSRTNRKAAAKASAAMAAAFEGPESSDDEVFMSIDDHQKECAKERRESRLGLGARCLPLPSDSAAAARARRAENSHVG